MSEYGLVEKPILEWLAGKLDDPNDSGLGWTYRTPEEMESFGRDVADPLTEALLIPALMRINKAVDSEAKARLAVEALRRVLTLPDPLDANRRTLETLRDGVPLVLVPGTDAVTVKFFAFERERLELNDFTITNQYVVKGSKAVRADTVLLVNGIPLVLAEYKSIFTSGHDWTEGVRQVHRYQQEAPRLLVPNLFCVAADEYEFRYGTVAFQINAARDIAAQQEHWRPWLSQYPLRRGYWNLPEHEKDEDAVRAATHGLLLPQNVLDFLEHFVLFETRKGRTVKKVARYQQFEAANDIVDRTLAGEFKTGLIWHTQGSGKSLTMIFAAYKLRRRPELDNPTVLIVVDRTDLKTQISGDFESCEYPSVVTALGVRDLKKRIRNERRETIITTLQCFQNMNDLEPSTRDNIIVLVDEAHRSQKGKEAGFAMTLRAKLPRAFRFGMTGTPIDRTMVNTHREFGPIVAGQQERYLSYYGIRQAIKDGATLEVYYEMHTVPVAVDEAPLNVSFEQMCEDVELDDEAEKELLQRREARWKALVCDPRRVQAVVSHLVEHFLAHPDPSGFKAQLVTVDRRACALYKAALDAELQKRNLPAQWSDVVISPEQNPDPELEPFQYSPEKVADLIERFKWTPAQYQAEQRKKWGEARDKWQPELKILIVCDKLLTGFDAPVEQVMYLDKPLRDHNLLQAIARTNRPLPEMDKRNGLVIDYFGGFSDLERALNFDERVREEALIDWDKLKEQMPIEIGRSLAPFYGIVVEDTRDCLFACLRRLSAPKTGQEFEAQFKRTQTLWEALSPDESLYEFRHQYAWLCGMYVAYRRRNRRAKATHEELAAKTREFIQQNTEFMAIAEEVPVYRIDQDYLVKVRALPSPADRAAELEAALNRELIEGGGGFRYLKLGERLKRVVDQKEAGDEAALKKIRELEAIVEEVNASKAEPERLGLTQPGEHTLFTVIREFAEEKDEALCVQAAKSMMRQLRQGHHLPAGWADTIGGRKKVSLTLQVAAWEPEISRLNLCPEDQTEPPFLVVAVDELAKALA